MSHILVAGIGNVFLGDDGFGVEVAQRLMDAPLRGATVVDFGIRGFDLAMAISSGVREVVLVDIVRRGGAPGTLYVLAAEDIGESGLPEGHGLDPVKAIALARAFGDVPPIRIVACEAASLEEGMGLSPEVTAAVLPAMQLVRELVEVSHA